MIRKYLSLILSGVGVLFWTQARAEVTQSHISCSKRSPDQRISFTFSKGITRNSWFVRFRVSLLPNLADISSRTDWSDVSIEGAFMDDELYPLNGNSWKGRHSTQEVQFSLDPNETKVGQEVSLSTDTIEFKAQITSVDPLQLNVLHLKVIPELPADEDEETPPTPFQGTELSCVLIR